MKSTGSKLFRALVGSASALGSRSEDKPGGDNPAFRGKLEDSLSEAHLQVVPLERPRAATQPGGSQDPTVEWGPWRS